MDMWLDAITVERNRQREAQKNWQQSNGTGGRDMQEVFEKIIEKMECEYENLKEMYKRTKDMSFYFTFQGVNKAIEIVKKEAEKYNDGHFGCNTNGEHERCYGCGLTDCKNRNRIWFGAVDDDTDTNVGSNGWIPVEEELPETDKYILLSFSNFSIPCVGRYEEDKNGGAFYIGDDDETCVSQDMFVNAWMNLPTPYQPKGE